MDYLLLVWCLPSFFAGGWVATKLIEREVLRRLASGELVEHPKAGD